MNCVTNIRLLTFKVTDRRLITSKVGLGP